MARYVFITGGVVSSLGKGIASAALGALLQARGYKVRLRKLDPYLNVDPGTMSPYQHGEVFVTDDGAETDLDLGHYERFTGRPANQMDNITTGRIYQDIIARGAARRLSRRHRSGHSARHRRHQDVHPRRQRRLRLRAGARSAARSATSRACRSSRRSARSRTTCRARQAVFIHLTLMPFIASAGELKTKPTQHSVERAPPDRHPARHPAGARRPADPVRGAAQAFAVLQRAPLRRHPGARRQEHLRRAGRLSHRGARRRGAGRLRHRRRAAAGPVALGPDHQRHRPSRRRGHHRRRRQVHGPQGRLQVAGRGAPSRRHRQHRQGQPRVDRGRHVWRASTRRRGSIGSTACWCPAASASAARKA